MPNIAQTKLGFLTWVYPTVLVLGVIALGHGQEQRQVAPNPNPTGNQRVPTAGVVRTPSVIGSLYCSNCHNHPENGPDQGLICQMVEYPVWKTKDRHQIAFDVLFTPRAQEMGRRLGINVTDDRGACLKCHGIVVPKGVEPFRFVARNDGVTCVVCHGTQQEWIAEHPIFNSPRWRDLTRAQKQDLKGMQDLWDPKTRAETCLSCHVGKIEQGKVLTHAMYAVGHPPLPSIEVAFFSEEEPRHWQYLREKPAAIQQHLGFNSNRLEQTELVAVSGLAALTASLELLASSASGRAPGAEWPDFSRYYCAACHHELSVANRSWRQSRGIKGAPGRPTAPAWPLALVQLGLEAADPDRASSWHQTLLQRLHDFDEAMTERPFGNLAKAGTIAREIVTWANEPLGVLVQMAQAKPGENRQVVDRARALRMLRRLGSIATESIPDYDSARQMAWAFRTIYHELEPNPEKRNPQINTILDRLDQKLQLGLNPRLPAGRKPIIDSLAERLRAAAGYNPVDFQKDMSLLVKLL